MNKKLSTIALAIVAAFGISAAAQCPAKCDKKADCEKTTCEKTCKQDCKKACDDSKLFEGITLTADQKTKIEALKADCKSKKEARATEAKAAREKAAKEKAEQRANRKAEYLAKMKTILAPEQYTKFLENMAVSNPGPRGHKMAPNGHRHGKDMKKGDRKEIQKSDISSKAKVKK
ncbi:MAG: hypothetical protein K2M12_03670 [Muribaculaceae bacterium]|nr:hypothetical protein [Muribaculaceae bacterium]